MLLECREKKSAPDADEGSRRSPSAPPADGGRQPFRILPLLIGGAVILFLLGSAVTEFRCFPYRQFLQPSYTAARALKSQLAATSSLRETDLWRSPRFQRRGVVRHLPEKASPGCTLYTSGHDCAAFLIDMQGRLLHRWRLPFGEAWPRPPHVRRPVPEKFVHWRGAHLLPNGDLIAMYEAAGDTPWGYGLVKVDRGSRVLWALAENTHHDFCLRDDGAIVVLAHQWRDSHDDPVPGASHLGRVLLDDFVLLVSPQGKVLRRISLLNAIAGSEYNGLLTTVSEDEWDLLHTNTVELITADFAAQQAIARPGHVMISLRSRHALAILDLDSGRIVWAGCGPYRSQHDPDVLPNGRVLLFDNRGHAGPGGPSRILELDPTSNAVHWSFAGSSDDPLYSHVRSTQQRLPNGNVLITESDGGRILEVTRGHQVVWEFRNPARLPEGPPSIAIVCGATRLPASRLRFAFGTNSNDDTDYRELNP